MRDRRAALQEELQNLHRTRKRELDVEMKRNQLDQLEKRLKFTRSERNKIENQVLERLQHELEGLKAELEVMQVFFFKLYDLINLFSLKSMLRKKLCESVTVESKKRNRGRIKSKMRFSLIFVLESESNIFGTFYFGVFVSRDER